MHSIAAVRGAPLDRDRITAFGEDGGSNELATLGGLDHARTAARQAFYCTGAALSAA